MLKVNTSNPEKQKEFIQYLQLDKTAFSHVTFPEPNGTEIDVITYKASQFADLPYVVLVDDCSLDVEGTDVFGVHVKWFVCVFFNDSSLIRNLHKLTEHIGKAATFRCHVAYVYKDSTKPLVFIFSGETKGHIVKQDGEGWGIAPHFQPEGSKQTLFRELGLGCHKNNPRWKAVQKFIRSQTETIPTISYIQPLMNTWKGSFQKKSLMSPAPFSSSFQMKPQQSVMTKDINENKATIMECVTGNVMCVLKIKKKKSK